MADVLHLKVATPECELAGVEVAEVQVPGRDGYLGILPGHAPLLGELGTGLLTYAAGTRRWVLAVQGGFLEVSGDHVRVLATVAERAEDIDLERARQALKAAQEQLASAGDPAAALEAARWAQARLSAAEQKQL